MVDLFGNSELATGYARSRPAVHPHVIERVRAHLGLRGPLDRALDVGCGAGLSTGPLRELARWRLGTDPVEMMLRSGPTVAPGAHFAAARAEALPVRSRSIDLITAAGSLDYADLDRFFPEAARVLAPDGALVVYDFSPGRTFRDSTALDDWYEEFVRRYPRPRRKGRPLDPEMLARRASGFQLRGQERFEVRVTLDAASYADYALTETNVAHAIRNDESRATIRDWCASSLGPVFDGTTRAVLFRAYLAYLVPV